MTVTYKLEPLHFCGISVASFPASLIHLENTLCQTCNIPLNDSFLKFCHAFISYVIFFLIAAFQFLSQKTDFLPLWSSLHPECPPPHPSPSSFTVKHQRFRGFEADSHISPIKRLQVSDLSRPALPEPLQRHRPIWLSADVTAAFRSCHANSTATTTNQQPQQHQQNNNNNNNINLTTIHTQSQ